MAISQNCNRKKYLPVSQNPEGLLNEARQLFDKNEHDNAFDVYEILADNFPQYSTEVLAEVFDKYQIIRDKGRFALYQSRIFDFNISADEMVIDVGSGHIPFPYATHLSDISTTDHAYGRAGTPFKHVGNKPVYEFNVEDIPFAEKEFDFVYTSHVLEHVDSPEKACSELMRVAKRGYIETPTSAKDMWLNTAKASNHRWKVRSHNGVLLFEEYSDEEIEGIKNDILMAMHVSPQTNREKALSALIYLKPQFFNTMVYWEEEFDYKVIRKNESYFTSSEVPKKVAPEIKISDTLKEPEIKKPLSFMQIHTFYQRYLDKFYNRDPRLTTVSFGQQIGKLIEDGFSGIHIFAPYMAKRGYDSHFVVANNRFSQAAWLKENNINKPMDNNFAIEVTKMQIENIKPDVLYLSDPINFDARFLQSLSYKPKLVVGWRAADIPATTDWTGFDVILSGLEGVRNTALEIGAKEALPFVPGFPGWINDQLFDVEADTDLVFGGSYTLNQHRKRNAYLKYMAESSNDFSLRYFLSGDVDYIDPAVARFNQGDKYGMELYHEMKRGKMIFDGRGDIRYLSSNPNLSDDIAKKETMNMRIFETTGLGRLLLTENFENLSNYFEIGKEIVAFENERDLIEKIKLYSTNHDLREEIALAGFNRCNKDYSMEARSLEFDKLIRERLGSMPEQTAKAVVNEPVAVDSNMDNREIVHEMLNTALHLLEENDLENAFKLLNEAKSYKFPVRNLDLARAIYFSRKNELPSVKQSLLEELAFFPDNSVAEKMLATLPDEHLRSVSDPEFETILKKIRPYTMLSTERLYSLYSKAKDICQNDIPGNFAECGVARGGSSALLAWVIKNYSKRERNIYSFDTFEGMPEPTNEDVSGGVMANDTGWGTGTCAAPMESLREVCDKMGVFDLVKPVKGLFQDTLPQYKSKVGELAFLHLDGDWYDSTKAILDNLYDNVGSAGILQVDDYGHWEGCRKAVNEFFDSRKITPQVNQIDFTGVWFSKPQETLPFESVVTSKQPEELSKLNLGCGFHFHPDWENVDFVAATPQVKAHNLREGVPYQDNSFDVVYHSHVLEHFPKNDAPKFINECYRVLKPEGILRIAFPDLETIAREYLSNMEDAMKGNPDAAEKYNWIMLEMYDQTVRNFSGGEMLKHWLKNPVPAYKYIVERLGAEATNFIDSVQKNREYHRNKAVEPTDPKAVGTFRMSGEVHQWMYDRYSAGKLLKDAGFRFVKVCKANESFIPGFEKYGLDVLADGRVRKPDSLFMEAVK